VRTVGVLLGTMPETLRGLLRHELEGQTDLVVLGDARTGQEMVARIELEQPDVVIVQGPVGGPEPAGAPALFDRPPLKVLVLSGDARHAAVYQVAPVGSVKRDVSAADLRAAIRAALEA